MWLEFKSYVLTNDFWWLYVQKICGLPKRQTCLLNKLGNKLRPDIEYQNKPNG